MADRNSISGELVSHGITFNAVGSFLYEANAELENYSLYIPYWLLITGVSHVGTSALENKSSLCEGSAQLYNDFYIASINDRLVTIKPEIVSSGINIISGSGQLISHYSIITQVPCAEQGIFVYNYGQSSIFIPTNESKYTRTNSLLVYSDFADMFQDRSAHDYRLKNIDSKIYDKGYVGNDFSVEATENTFKKDLSGAPRPGPVVSIGAIELMMVLEFNGSDIIWIKERKLRYDSGIFVAEDGEQFTRIPGLVIGDLEDYAIERKICIKMKPTDNQNVVTDKAYKVLYEFDALYESGRNTLVLYKTSSFNSGLFLKMIGKDQYIFLYDDTTRKLTIGILEMLNTGITGYRSVINTVRFG